MWPQTSAKDVLWREPLPRGGRLTILLISLPADSTTIATTNGHGVLLGSEENPYYLKNNDGLLNDLPMDIKTVESNGVWSISSKLREAEKQGAQVVVLYFPQTDLYSRSRVLDGISKYENNPQIQAIKSIKSCLVIAGDQIVDYLKKATTPSAEWF